MDRLMFISFYVIIFQHHRGCKKKCTKMCGYRKAGLKCSQFCKNCKGKDCGNEKLLENNQSATTSKPNDPGTMEVDENSDEEINIDTVNHEPAWLNNVRMRYLDSYDLHNDDNTMDYDKSTFDFDNY